MTQHYENRIHWNRLLAIIRKAGKDGVAIYSLAEQLDVKKGDKELEKTINQLKVQGKVHICMGTYKDMLCRFIIAQEILNELQNSDRKDSDSGHDS